jgi:hypothetical protein
MNFPCYLKAVFMTFLSAVIVFSPGIARGLHKARASNRLYLSKVLPIGNPSETLSRSGEVVRT